MSHPIPQRYRLGQVTGRTDAERIRRWTRRLAEADDTERVPTVQLFAGEHWSVARGLSALGLPGEDVQLWICSAGYGLVPASARLVPYHATWTQRQADSVPGRPDAWWSRLGEWGGPAAPAPRSIRALAESDQGATFVLVLSQAYLRACQDDVLAATAHMTDPNRLLVVSAGTRAEGELAAFVVPADARLQSYLGGTRRALNARIAANLLSAGIRGKREAAEHLDRLLAVQLPAPRYERRRQSDEELLDLIGQSLARTPGTPASRLLRNFRDAGLACEQHRFTRLYRMAELRRNSGHP